MLYVAGQIEREVVYVMGKHLGPAKSACVVHCTAIVSKHFRLLALNSQWSTHIIHIGDEATQVSPQQWIKKDGYCSFNPTNYLTHIMYMCTLVHDRQCGCVIYTY